MTIPVPLSPKWVFRGAVLSACFSAFHFAAVTYVPAKDALLARAENTRRGIIADLAEGIGYEQRREVAEVTVKALVRVEAKKRKLNPDLVEALIHAESEGKQFAVSHKGAIGLMQIMPANAKRCGLDHYGALFESDVNIQCGVQIFAEEMQTYADNPIEAIAAYNGGPRAVTAIRKCGLSSPKCLGDYTESAGLAKTVLSLTAKAEG